jgi:NAD(P)-dependent dehydrogenase (short-subunit alcohol dehydrogenase family)
MADTPVALIVGGGTGIGFATAGRLLDRGVAVALTGRRDEVLATAVRRLEEDRADAALVAIAGDSSQAEDAQRVVDRTVARFGRLDYCVNCAGIYEPAHVLEMDGDCWQRTMSSNVDAVFYPSAAAAKAMVASGGGRFDLIGSTSGPLSEPETIHYNASKAAVESMARSLAVDLAKHGIIANAVAPGWVHTELVDEFVQNADPEAFEKINILGRVGKPDEVANLIEYLLLDAPAYLNAATIFIDGGQTSMAPMI